MPNPSPEYFDGAVAAVRQQANRINRDYVQASVDAERDADHAQARQRGQRLADIADHIADNACQLDSRPTREHIKAAAIDVLAGWLYPGAAIDMPRRR